MAVSIRFLGLITHTTEGGDAAVLYIAPAHEARLMTERRFIDGEDPDDHSIKCFDLKNCVISFSGLSGPVNRSGLIGVPSLHSIGGSGGTVSPDVNSRTTGGVFSAFVELAGGRYRVEDYYEHRVTYNGVDNICLPQTITFESPVTTALDVIGLGTTLRLRPGAVITIINAEPTTVSTGPHYLLYGNFFLPPATIIVPMKIPTNPCPNGNPEPDIPKCPDELKHTVGVECSNSQYP